MSGIKIFIGMLTLSNSHRYFVYQDFCNMRYGFNSLGGLVNNSMKEDLLSGDIFIFFNRRRNQCKLLRFSGDGFELFHKKLIKGTFEIPEDGEIEAFQLQLLLEGVVVDSFSKKVRFSLKKTA